MDELAEHLLGTIKNAPVHQRHAGFHQQVGIGIIVSGNPACPDFGGQLFSPGAVSCVQEIREKLIQRGIGPQRSGLGHLTS